MQENHGLNPQTYTWLLNSPYACIQALTLRNLLDKPASHQTLRRAQREAHQSGCIAAVLNQMHPNGYWAEPGAGYLPKYRSTVWSLILLAQLGAQARLDARITTAARYYLDQAFCEQGQIGKAGSPSHTVDCLQGNMLAALLDLGIEDERMEKAFDWMARSVTAEGLQPREDQKAELRYYSGKCGPNFACGANNQLPCAWGAVKVMLAFGKLQTNIRRR